MKNTYSFNIIPPNDSERVEALKKYHILNTPTEKDFDNIVKLAITIFRVPIAHISFLDAEYEFVKASIGIDGIVLVNRGESVCALSVLEPQIMVVEDALYDPVFNKHPYVHGEFGLRFYAGAPIITPDDHIIGTVCLVDTQPRTLSPHQKEILQSLASVVMDQVELRLSNLEKAERQQKTTDLLAASEKRLKGILDTMAEGVSIVDVKGKLVYINQMAQKIFGLPDLDITERSYNDAKWKNLRLDGTLLPDEEHPMTIALKTGLAAHDQEIGIKIPRQEVFYISINAAPIVNAKGEVTGGIATFMDVTNRRKLMKQKDEFISIASHELKTPITSLKASIQLLNRIKNDPSSPMLSKLIDQANKSLEKLSNLVNDLLNVNRIAQGQLTLRKTTFVLADMINDCCQLIRATGHHEIRLNGDLSLKIYADELRIDQVVVNIINNAIKYAPDSKYIEISIEQLDSWAKVSVKDSGPGIAAEKLPHLFDRYYRADYSGVQFSGLGLGLYIGADIIKKHGGEIGVDTMLGTGSTFWFTLPLEDNA
ncbi:PAS domain S-box-containing protein [Mucilaginibacter frigoritolerans]|uniref:histidine kinase n=1 Tax=Mucilaginibacter frigoritolerans TaxID=652788 RepID=A0A562UDF8_9SPHI|nr:ATP-binding protein [Mucilaginibacter frigoritolerans]TWJ03507.1 PAS domain S-box-containing protein [Mucilaginibacter frigoritolerans]